MTVVDLWRLACLRLRLRLAGVWAYRRRLKMTERDLRGVAGDVVVGAQVARAWEPRGRATGARGGRASTSLRVQR